MYERRYPGPISKAHIAGHEFGEFDRQGLKHEKQKEVTIAYLDVILGKHRFGCRK
jgi:hypothetical protein